MDIRVLGPIEVAVDGEAANLGGHKQRALLGLLIAEAPKVVTSDALIGGLWGEEAADGARSTLQTYVSNLRHVVGDTLVFGQGGYRLEVDSSIIDSVRFVTALEEARSLLATDPAATAGHLREALALWRGRPFADLVDVPGLEWHARRLEELRLEAVELRIDAELASGRHGVLVAELEALAAEHPIRERFRAQHMLALYRSGRQGEALRAYRTTETYLAEELGVDPSQELQELELAILQHDESLLGGSGRVVTQRLAFLVTDIEGSTRLWDRHPQEMAGGLAIHDRLLRSAIEETGGRVFKHTGDGVMAVFQGANQAVEAAEKALRALAEADWGEVGELKVRLGVDIGEAESRGGDFFGPPLNRAARLCAAAHGGQVLISASVQNEVVASARPGIQIRQLGEYRLRGMATPERIAQLVFVGLPGDFPDLRVDAEPPLGEGTDIPSLPGYELRERIGEGAFGVVWRAYQPSVGREVAIKVIRSELASQPSFVRRFEAEARTIARLAHPHIVPLIDFWRDPDSAYLVLAMQPGGALRGAMSEGRIERHVARRILAQIGAALDHAHSQGLAHGDVKPANILLDGSGNAYLSDFGITARLLSPELLASVSSAPEYRAPEEPTSGPSPSADLYALGVLAGELLDGAADFQPVLARATAANPEDRYPSAAGFLGELDEMLGEEAAAPARPVVSRNPFKGLRAFERGDAADFHGREELVRTLLAAASNRRWVTVVGPSGSGKSSVVRAGLLPALASGRIEGSKHWYVIDMTPGPEPIESLAKAVESFSTRPVDSGRLADEGLGAILEGDGLIVVDQFEELFTVSNAKGRDRFLEVLADAVENEEGGLRVVATLRADFYDRPLAHPRVGRLVRDGLVTVLPPTREEIVAMITVPAEAVGLRWEPGLPHRIAEDVAHQPGALPLLQYALTEMVERRSGDLLTAADYTRVGGVAGALTGRAESLYQDLTVAQQEAARQVLLRLVTVSEETDDTRRRVRRSELESIGIARSDLDRVLDMFTSQRLLLTDRDPATRGPTLEVAHEALLREWPRLEGWIDDQREALILGRRLRSALEDWEANDRHADYLLTGTRLAPFVGWAETASLTTAEQAFYRASSQKDTAERAARRRRRRTLVAVLAGASVVAIALGLLAVFQARQATRERDRALSAESAAEIQRDRALEAEELAERRAESARRAEQIAFSRELAASAVSVLDDDPELSLLLGLEAMEQAPEEESLPVHFYTAFHSALRSARTLLNQPWEQTWEPDARTGRISPDGGLIAVSASPGVIEMREAASGELVWEMRDEAGGGWFWHPHFSPDGTTLAVAFTRYWSEDRRVDGGLGTGIYLLSPETGDIVDLVEPPNECEWIGLPRNGAFTRDGEHLIRLVDVPGNGAEAGCFDGAMEVQFMDLGSGEIVGRFETTAAPREDFPVFVSVGIDSTDTAAVISDQGGFGNSMRALDRESGEVLWESSSAVGGFPSPAGNVVASAIPGPAQLSIQLVDPLTGEVLHEITDDGSWAGDLTLSADGSRLYTSRADGSAGAWDTTSGRLLMDLSSGSHLGRISVDQSDAILASVGPGGLRTFDLTTQRLGEGLALDISPNQAATGAIDATEDLLAVSGFHGECPEQYGETLLVGIPGSTVLERMYDVGGNTLTFTPNGGHLVHQTSVPGEPDVPCNQRTFGPLVMKDPSTGAIQRELGGLCAWLNDDSPGFPPHCEDPPGHPYGEFVQAISVTSDGTLLAAGGASGAYSVWNLRTGTIVSTVKVEEGCCLPGVAIHPAGSMVGVASGARSRMSVFDLEGELIYEVKVPANKVQFTPDGAHLVATLADGQLRVFDVGDWSWWEIDAHQGFVNHLDISPSGRLVATVGGDGFVKVADLTARQIVHEIELEGDFAKAVAFIDDEHIAIGTQNGLVAVLTTNAAELAEIGRVRLARTLTEGECRTYLHLEACPATTVAEG